MEDRVAITSEVIATLAGPLAQARFVDSPSMKMMGVPWSFYGEGGDDSDMAITRRLLVQLNGVDSAAAQHELQQLVPRTEELLDQTPRAWDAINTLAAVLYDQETLSYEEATRIIQAALDH